MVEKRSLRTGVQKSTMDLSVLGPPPIKSGRYGARGAVSPYKASNLLMTFSGTNFLHWGTAHKRSLFPPSRDRLSFNCLLCLLFSTTALFYAPYTGLTVVGHGFILPDPLKHILIMGDWWGVGAPLNANTAVKRGNRRALIEDWASLPQGLLCSVCLKLNSPGA